jgi:hypothetical protein
MFHALHILLVLLGLWLFVSTLLNFSKSPDWYIRNWDFPRVYATVLAMIIAGVYAALFPLRSRRRSVAWIDGTSTSPGRTRASFSCG